MAIALVTKFLPYVDELFSKESKKSLLTNQEFNWTGAHTVKVYKIGTSDMTDYGRSGPAEEIGQGMALYQVSMQTRKR